MEGTWTAEFEGPDGQRVAFPRTGTGFGRAVGIDALVERAGSGLVLAWFDGRRWEFDAAGRVERTWAGPGTAVRFGHDDDGRLVELVHERGRRLGLEWDGDRDRRGVRLGRAARRLPLRPGTAGRGGRTGGRAPLRRRTARAGWRR